MKKMKYYIFGIPNEWDPKHCCIDINLKTGDYKLLNLEPDKIVERYDGKLKQFVEFNIFNEEDDEK